MLLKLSGPNTRRTQVLRKKMTKSKKRKRRLLTDGSGGTLQPWIRTCLSLCGYGIRDTENVELKEELEGAVVMEVRIPTRYIMYSF
jgi:hypothetical protein